MGVVRHVAEEERHDREHRAGTRLVAPCRVLGTVNGADRDLGRYDEILRVFQTGGTANDFKYWKLRLYTMPAQTWDAIQATRCERIEWVDHATSTAWWCSMQDAKEYGQFYEDPRNSIGQRFGVPFLHVRQMPNHEAVLPPPKREAPTPTSPQMLLF